MIARKKFEGKVLKDSGAARTWSRISPPPVQGTAGRIGWLLRTAPRRAGGARIGLWLALVLLVARAPAAADLVIGSADDATRPADDFYQYVNRDWLRQTALPTGRTSFDTFAALQMVSAKHVQTLIQSAADGTLKAIRPNERPIIKLIGDYYAAEADTAAIEAAGLKSLATELAVIAAISDARSLATVLGRDMRLDDGTNTRTESLFGVWVHQGFHDPNHYAVHLVQGGLGLVDRDDYLDTAPARVDLRNRYLRHLTRLLAMANIPNSEQRARGILDLEIDIARSHAPRADTDNVFKTDNVWHLADFLAKAPGLDWAAYFVAARVDMRSDLIVWQPSAAIGAASLASTRPLEAWKDYLTLHLIEHYAPVLTSQIAGEHFALLAGLPEATPPLDRVQLAVSETNSALAEAVGRLYVDRYFSTVAKAAATDMVENIRAAFSARLAAIKWMSPATKPRSLAKLESMQVGVGYPDRWIDYSGLEFRRREALDNRRRAEQFAYRQSLEKLKRTVDPAEWALAPQSVNALINFSPNALQFSAALLQPPFFDPAGDVASNYGSAGAGISHEIWHSFDDLGHIYDDNGRLWDWWASEDKTAYAAAVRPLALQASTYCVHAQLCVQGDQVLVESIADLVGLSMAHDAYLLSLHGAADEIKQGLTGEQRFFRAFAQRWRRVQTDVALAHTIATDPHLPSQFRANAVRNLDAWYVAFGSTPGDRLYLKSEARVRLP